MSLQTKFVWLNGQLVPFAKAQIHVLNHSLHYGSGVFEGIRFYQTSKGPAVFRLKDHLDRLAHSAEVMGMKINFNQKELIFAVSEVIKRNQLKEGYIRPLIFFGERMGLNPQGAPVNVLIAAWPWGKYLEKESVKVKISSLKRIHPDSSVMTAKICGHYANSILASLEAKKAGFDEALFLDCYGNIAEGPGENIFFVKNQKIYTPQIGTILPGLTRDSLMSLAKDNGFSINEKSIKPKELKKFDEAFFTGTAAEVNAIGRIDEVIFQDEGEGPVTKKLREAYFELVHGENQKYQNWLTWIR